MKSGRAEEDKDRSEKERKGNNGWRGRKDQDWGKWKGRKSKRTEGRETRVSDGFHVFRAELAPGGCGWTLMRKVLVGNGGGI